MYLTFNYQKKVIKNEQLINNKEGKKRHQYKILIIEPNLQHPLIIINKCIHPPIRRLDGYFVCYLLFVI